MRYKCLCVLAMLLLINSIGCIKHSKEKVMSSSYIAAMDSLQVWDSIVLKYRVRNVQRAVKYGLNAFNEKAG